MTIHDKYSITETEAINTNNNFFKSLETQFQEKQELSEKQEQALMNMLERELPHQDLLDMKTYKSEYAIIHYYRYDYHGDALSDSCIGGLYKNLSDSDKTETITNEMASQYGVSSTDMKYTKSNKMAELPEGIDKDEDRFATYRSEAFSLALKKLRANRFRKVATKNRTIQILRWLLDTSNELFIELNTNDMDFLKGAYRYW